MHEGPGMPGHEGKDYLSKAHRSKRGARRLVRLALHDLTRLFSSTVDPVDPRHSHGIATGDRSHCVGLESASRIAPTAPMTANRRPIPPQTMPAVVAHNKELIIRNG